ncbi:MAG TPA: SUF system NifU family Fe-S cluster assembly protein, partial [Gammaproteobacteria bacterium]|nr:SUF system NifU family Fe-S cluster assembly protein [Gammaproteobacteria bacterium]
VLPHATHQQLGHNPLCGDKVMVYVVVREEIIEEIRFAGDGCAISIASASLMTEMVKGKKITDVEKLFDGFHHLVTEGKEPQIDLGKLTIFSGVAEFPIRVKCATLAWHTLKSAYTCRS